MEENGLYAVNQDMWERKGNLLLCYDSVKVNAVASKDRNDSY